MDVLNLIRPSISDRCTSVVSCVMSTVKLLTTNIAIRMTQEGFTCFGYTTDKPLWKVHANNVFMTVFKSEFSCMKCSKVHKSALQDEQVLFILDSVPRPFASLVSMARTVDKKRTYHLHRL